MHELQLESADPEGLRLLFFGGTRRGALFPGLRESVHKVEDSAELVHKNRAQGERHRENAGSFSRRSSYVGREHPHRAVSNRVRDVRGLHRLSHRLHRVHRADDAVSEPRGALPPFVLMRRSTSACPTSTTL